MLFDDIEEYERRLWKAVDYLTERGLDQNASFGCMQECVRDCLNAVRAIKLIREMKGKRPANSFEASVSRSPSGEKGAN